MTDTAEEYVAKARDHEKEAAGHLDAAQMKQGREQRNEEYAADDDYEDAADNYERAAEQFEADGDLLNAALQHENASRVYRDAATLWENKAGFDNVMGNQKRMRGDLQFAEWRHESAAKASIAAGKLNFEGGQISDAADDYGVAASEYDTAAKLNGKYKGRAKACHLAAAGYYLMIGQYIKSADEWKKGDPVSLLEDDEPPVHRPKLHKLDNTDDD